MGNDNGDVIANAGMDAKFDCHTSSGTGTGTFHSNYQVSYDQCHSEISKALIINLGNYS